jgi:putative hydrolase of the HAD superfamily
VADILADAFARYRRKYHTVYDDAIKCLETVPRDYNLALLTNGATDLQREKIICSGIEKYFKEVIISGEIGFGKPDKRIFQLALSRFGVSPEQAVMVGDSLQSDISGAKATGIKAVWLNRKGILRDNSVIPDIEIPSLFQLREYL